MTSLSSFLSPCLRLSFPSSPPSSFSFLSSFFHSPGYLYPFFLLVFLPSLPPSLPFIVYPSLSFSHPSFLPLLTFHFFVLSTTFPPSYCSSLLAFLLFLFPNFITPPLSFYSSLFPYFPLSIYFPLPLFLFPTLILFLPLFLFPFFLLAFPSSFFPLSPCFLP